MPRCKYCKTKFEAKYFNQKYCLKNDACIKSFTESVKEQREKLTNKAWRKEKKELRSKLETKTDIEKKLEKEINSIVRLIDKNHNCISSGRPLGKNYDAGHFYSVGSNPQIRFHLFNIFAQSVHDNRDKSGNPLEYMSRLKELFGSEMQEYCLALKGLPSLHLSQEELKDKIVIAKSIIKWLKLQDRIYTHKERIELRDQFNSKLGIY